MIQNLNYTFKKHFSILILKSIYFVMAKAKFSVAFLHYICWCGAQDGVQNFLL